MIFQKSEKNWNDYSVYLKRGRCIKKELLGVKFDNNIDYTQISNIRKQYSWYINKEIPIFSDNTNYINDLLKIEEE